MHWIRFLSYKFELRKYCFLLKTVRGQSFELLVVRETLSFWWCEINETLSWGHRQSSRRPLLVLATFTVWHRIKHEIWKQPVAAQMSPFYLCCKWSHIFQAAGCSLSSSSVAEIQICSRECLSVYCKLWVLKYCVQCCLYPVQLHFVLWEVMKGSFRAKCWVKLRKTEENCLHWFICEWDVSTITVLSLSHRQLRRSFSCDVIRKWVSGIWSG